MRRPALVAVLCSMLAPAACGGGGGGGDDDGDDDAVDAATPDEPDAPNVPSEVVVSGETQTVQGTDAVALAGASVEAFDDLGGAALATTTSGSGGAYSLTVPTGGGPVDGYFRGRSAGLLDTYLYPPSDVTEDTTGVTLLLVSGSTLSSLTSLAGATYDPGKGFIALIVADAAGNPVTGATVTIAPAGTARVIYSSGGFPSGSATATDASGTVYIANTNTGAVTVDATAGGTAFQELTFEARAGALTTTVLIP